jgi:hypothetical protein
MDIRAIRFNLGMQMELTQDGYLYWAVAVAVLISESATGICHTFHSILASNDTDISRLSLHEKRKVFLPGQTCLRVLFVHYITCHHSLTVFVTTL